MNPDRGKLDGYSYSNRMLVGERRRHILQVIQSEGQAFVHHLSDSLTISRATIGKDLNYLQNQGLVERTHGGALRMRSEPTVDAARQEENRQSYAEDLRIAEAAAGFVEEGQSVILDSGSTAFMLARALRRFRDLTVVTNALDTARELMGTEFDVVLTGGRLRKDCFSLAGPLAEDLVDEIHADIFFLDADGFDVQTGPSKSNLLEARVNRQMVQSSSRTIVVCPSTKFLRGSLACVVSLSAVQQIITDRGLPPPIAQILRAQNVNVMLV